jgi:hypothetical protein
MNASRWIATAADLAAMSLPGCGGPDAAPAAAVTPPRALAMVDRSRRLTYGTLAVEAAGRLLIGRWLGDGRLAQEENRQERREDGGAYEWIPRQR